MIAQIDIENFALFEKSRITFGPGLNVLTGESGSGKSLVLESLVTLFGARMAPERMGSFGSDLRLRAVLQLDAGDARWEPFTALGIEPDDVLIVERAAGQDGRSQYRAQGQAVPAQVIRTLGDSLLQYVGQHQVLKAASPQYVLEWVDRYGGLDALRRACDQAYRQWQGCDQAVQALADQASNLGEIEDKRRVLEELTALDVQVGEDESIQRELVRLRAGRKLLEASQALYQLLDGDTGTEGVLAELAEARHLSEVLSGYDDGLRNMADAAAQAEQAMAEVRLDVSRWMDRLDLDPVRLETLEARADVLSRVKRRYGPELSDVLAYRERLQEEIARLDNLEWELARLVAQRDQASDRLNEAADALSRGRQQVLGPAAEELTARIQEMEMPTGQVAIVCERGAVGPRGADILEVQFSANQGQPLKPLAKVASGGELARVALALAVTGQHDDGTIYVFDEVDQGLGGASAERVGRLLADLGNRTQVLAVSHQSVVAARAEHHVGVFKVVQAGRSQSRTRVLTGDDRVQEIARMLSGSQDAIALKHAQSLLSHQTD